LLALLAVYLSFIKRFKSLQAYLAMLAVAIGLCVIGFAGFVYSGIDYYFGIIKPLDYVILLQLGVIFGIYILSYQHPAANLKALSLSQSYLKFKRTLLKPLPKPSAAINRTHRPRPA
jgi:hypothetical protein